MKKEYWDACPPILKEYLGYVETIKGRSVNTVNGYFIDLRDFFRYMKWIRGLAKAENMAEIDIADIDLAFIKTITLTDVFEYLSFVKNQRANSNSARARKTVSLRMFFRYLTDHTHQLEVNPIQNLETPKIKKSLPKHLTLEQSIQLLDSVDGPFAKRDYCMLTLLLNCGLRRAELAGLNLTDIGQDRTLRVVGKGNKERVLYLNDACWNAVQEYLKVRPVDGVKDRQALFLSSRKQRMTLEGIHYVVKRYLKQVGGAENMSAHKLRHTAATLMYQHGGVDVRVLKDILGHENLGTTEIYTHLSNQQVRQAIEHHPLAGVGANQKKHTKKE